MVNPVGLSIARGKTSFAARSHWRVWEKNVFTRTLKRCKDWKSFSEKTPEQKVSLKSVWMEPKNVNNKTDFFKLWIKELPCIHKQ